jgi:hypothetical protein
MGKLKTLMYMIMRHGLTEVDLDLAQVKII